MAANFLTECGKPLFFPIANAAELGLSPPEDRLGESVRAWARAVGGMQKEAFVVSRPTGSAWRLASDEGEYLKGQDAAPCPLSFFTTGMVTAFMESALGLARVQGVEVRGLRLTQDNYYVMTGSALKGTMTGGALPVELAVEFEADLSGEKRLQLLQDAVARAPIADLVRRQFDSLFTLTHNGRSVSPARVAAVAGAVQPDLGDRFDAAVAAGDGKGLITKLGMTERTQEATSSAGSSLADEQNRRLHIRGVCTRREDGLFEIEQHLFNPHGSIFRFMADAADLRAPGAAAYVSAGIAFCFMTQLGRYATIARKALEEYRVVQDTHFSRSGESAGRMGAVETHLHLATGESDDFARTCLDMSEQTCFLHALCRTPLDVRVSVNV